MTATQPEYRPLTKDFRYNYLKMSRNYSQRSEIQRKILRA